MELRSLQAQDADALYAAVHGARQHLQPWLPWVAGTRSVADSLAFIENTEEQYRQQTGLVLGIVHGGKLVGTVGMNQWDHATNRAQIGYWIVPELQGQGVVRRAVGALVAYLFGKVGLAKLEIHFAASNKRSAAVAARLGFVVEGVIRQAMHRNGAAEDMVITGLLKREWKAV